MIAEKSWFSIFTDLMFSSREVNCCWLSIRREERSPDKVLIWLSFWARDLERSSMSLAALASDCSLKEASFDRELSSFAVRLDSPSLSWVLSPLILIVKKETIRIMLTANTLP